MTRGSGYIDKIGFNMDQTHVKDKDRNVINFDDFKKKQDKLMKPVDGEPNYGQRDIKAEESYVRHDSNVYRAAGIKFQKKDADNESKVDPAVIPNTTGLIESVDDSAHWQLRFEREFDEVGTFWVVTKPTEDSTLADCCFSSTIDNIVVQKQGGLTQAEIVGFFTDKGRAEAKAKQLMDEFKK